ncbi:hypothetical protein ACP70R_000419 [Stipagrostis hirtigluma subsp. patula]
MEATALSVGKSVLDGALGYAKSALAEEVALQLGVQRDHAFIRDELEMMQAFLKAAHDDHDKEEVRMIWVKQVRDVAYDAEDNLKECSIHLQKPSWWRLPRTLRERRRIAKQMKELRARVEDISQRNMRYQLFKSTSPKPGAGSGQSSLARAEMSGAEEAMRQQNKAKMDLIGIINKKDANLRVIALGGTTHVFEEEDTSIIKRAYDDLKRSKKFECHAWIRIIHPFNPTEFLQSIVRQFFVHSLDEATNAEQNSIPAAQDLRRMAMMKEDDLVDSFKAYVNCKSYLIVLGDLSTIEEWEWIKICFPNNKKGSRLIICAHQVEVASLCVGPETKQPEHMQLFPHRALYAFYEKEVHEMGVQQRQGSAQTQILTDNNDAINGGKLTRKKTMVAAFEETQLIGRVKEKLELIKLISNNDSQEFKVISICGMGGLGKTTLVKDVYQSQELSVMFEKRACVTVKRPFHPSELLSSLATQLSDRPDGRAGGGHELPVADLLAGKSYLIVLDDLFSTEEWDSVIRHFPTAVTTSRIIVTTREVNIAKHCSENDGNICKLETLGEEEARNLFIEKVFGEIIDFDEQYPELADEAKCILKKCKGLPLAIVTIGGFLAAQPKTSMVWRKLNERIGAELMNQEFGTIKDVLVRSYDGLPYELKSCFLYLSIFPEDHNISRRRLVRRWAAEGYSSGVHGKSSEEITDGHFMGLIDRSMILSSQQSILSRKGIDSCQVHDLMREISIMKSTEEKLVFRLEEGCSSDIQGTARHLAISSNWKGDKSEFDSAVDMSRIRSLTVFGKWRSFFVSDKMRILHVLDLESTQGLVFFLSKWRTQGLVDHHLEHIGRLLHLKYISLRECKGIYHLPDSWGNLRQLETLDMKGTNIHMLPKGIIKLTKLQYLYCGDQWPDCVYPDERWPRDLRKLCLACCATNFLKDVEELEGDPNRQDVCAFWRHVILPALASSQGKPFGVVLPRGVRKFKALHTLGKVNIARDKAILQDIKSLTQLRKLAVTGINKRNCQELCSALASLGCLQSLSVHSWEDATGLHGCLDAVSPAPKNLQSLKLYVNLLKLPEWIVGLQNLVKLKLWRTELTELDGTMRVLGKLPNLAILFLRGEAFKGQGLCLSFRQEAFPSLMVMELLYVCALRSVEFEEGAAPKLELLRFSDRLRVNAEFFSGVASLISLKQFQLRRFDYIFMENLRDQLAQNPNRPVLKKFD